MNKTPHVYWLTGLSDSGKSTMCRKLVEYLRERDKAVILLDGDEIRAVVGATQAHTREDRLALALRYSRLCKLLSDQGFDVAIATISLFEEVHDWNRKNLPGYCEIFLDVPIDELKRRDTKGIYERFDRKELKNVAGIDLKVDYPKNPDVVLHFTASLDQDAMFAELISQLIDLGRL
jgi:adenylylsulfate kinase